MRAMRFSISSSGNSGGSHADVARRALVDAEGVHAPAGVNDRLAFLEVVAVHGMTSLCGKSPAGVAATDRNDTQPGLFKSNLATPSPKRQ